MYCHEDVQEDGPYFFRAEYIAQANADKCTGCMACFKACVFKAIENDRANNKIRIDPKKCYGCGLCRAMCKTDSITLNNRYDVPNAAVLW
jgi:ferredoxin